MSSRNRLENERGKFPFVLEGTEGAENWARQKKEGKRKGDRQTDIGDRLFLTEYQHRAKDGQTSSVHPYRGAPLSPFHRALLFTAHSGPKTMNGYFRKETIIGFKWLVFLGKCKRISKHSEPSVPGRDLPLRPCLSPVSWLTFQADSHRVIVPRL